MKPKHNLWRTAAGLGVLAMLQSSAPAFAAGAQETFQTPERALTAFAAANRADDKKALLEILGPDGEKLVSSGDDVADKASRQRFLAAYDKAHSIERKNADKAVIVVGEDAWPMPIPLVRQDKGWRFDTKAGQEEILDRRIGRNELNVIQICRAYVEAQYDYADQHPLDHKRSEFAQHFLSTEGKHDGLYWPRKPGEPESPIGPLIASARAEGYLGEPEGKANMHSPYHGYFYKILKRQGTHAGGGAKNYVTDGHMDGGFALLAFPARYGDSGIMTFELNQTGIVYEKDLGPDTQALAAKITEYDPDNMWQMQ